MAEAITANNKQFMFELVAPEKVELASMEERVTLPGEIGDFMVFIGHTPLLAGLRPGVVTVGKNGGDEHYFITGGFADVGNEHCIILTPHITPVAKLNAEKLAQEVQNTEKALTETKEKHEQEHLQEQLQVLRLKLEASKKYGIAANAN
jgi:F-type H+-transporting ATPase subunit epsilon